MSTSRRPRGFSLLEALIACAVVALGMLGIAKLQTQLRASADTARQRADAVRLAQQEMEALRTFTQVASAAGRHAYADLADRLATLPASPSGGNVAYTVARRLAASGTPGALDATIQVTWADRGGAAQQVLLASVVAGSEPAQSGALAAVPRPASPQGAYGRSIHVPLAARDLGDGRSAFKPVRGGEVALVMDNASGAVLERCTGLDPALSNAALTAATLTACDGRRGLLLRGHVRFGSGGNEVPLPAAIALALSGGSYSQAPQCTTEAMKTALAGDGHVHHLPIAAALAAGSTDTGERSLDYHCVVYPLASGAWSGRSTLVGSGWTVGTASGDRRICRYSADQDGSGAIEAAIEHPAAYAGVMTALAQQNFLVLPAAQPCPGGSAVAVNASADDVFVDLGTAAHQP